MAERRAGGHVDRGDGKGWVLDDSPAPPVPEFVPQVQEAAPAVPAAGGWVLSPPATPTPAPAPAPAPEPEPPVEEAPSDAEVRAWAKRAGVDVPARGRLSKDIVDQYLNREK